jgi:hypothetical protein
MLVAQKYVSGLEVTQVTCRTKSRIRSGSFTHRSRDFGTHTAWPVLHVPTGAAFQTIPSESPDNYRLGKEPRPSLPGIYDNGPDRYTASRLASENNAV